MFTFALRENGGSYRTVIFPTTPEELKVSLAAHNETYDLLATGEVALAGHAGLRRIKFSIYLPPTATPRATLTVLDDFCRQKASLHFIVCRQDRYIDHLFDTNIDVILEELVWREKGGEPGAFFVDLLLCEYRQFSLRVSS